MAKRSKAAEPALSETAGEKKDGNTTENSLPEVPGSAIGTTAALFGEQETVSEQPEPTAPEEKQEEVARTEPQPEPQPEEFYLEDVLSKQGIPLDKVKARIKVDGKEEVISFDEYRKRVQLKEHLDRAGQELGRQRRELIEMRKGKDAERNQISSVPAHADQTAQTRNAHEVDPYFAAIERRLAEIEARTVPIVHDTNRQQLIKELKAEGFDDAADLLPRIELEIGKVEDPQLQDYYDTIPGAKALAYRLKNQDLMEQLKKKEEAPKAAPLERPKPPIQKIDGGSQQSTLGVTDDWQAKRDELFKRWQATRDQRSFRALLEHQNSLVFK